MKYPITRLFTPNLKRVVAVPVLYKSTSCTDLLQAPATVLVVNTAVVITQLTMTNDSINLLKALANIITHYVIYTNDYGVITVLIDIRYDDKDLMCT